MTIRMNRVSYGPGRVLARGAVVSLSEDEEARLVESGAAEPVESAMRKTSTATHQPQRTGSKANDGRKVRTHGNKRSRNDSKR